MTNEQIKALCAILDYMEKDEARDWEECNRPKNHIYMDILTMREFLNENE